MIPKLIMQTWKTKELPEKWKTTQTSIKKFMPDWEYVLMTDEMNREFISKHFPDFLKTFDSFPHNIQRADAIRYAWLFVHGGLYLDCDFELLAPLDELFESDDNLYLLHSANSKNSMTNEFIAAQPGNVVFLEMMKEMKKKPFFSRIQLHLLIMYTTGPWAFSKVIMRTKVPYKQLPNSKVKPYSICFTEYNNPEALLKPLEGSSWCGSYFSMFRWCFCNTKIIFSILIGILILCCVIMFFLFTEY